MNTEQPGFPATSGTPLDMRISLARDEAQGIRSFELRPVAPGSLPAFDAGAHVELNLPNGLKRSYSLTNDSRESDRYVIAVNLDERSRGGSRYIHEFLREGDVVTASAPRNHFSLDESAPHSVLFAGGIGVTPLLCMARQLTAQGRSWEMHYYTRSRNRAAFVNELVDLAARGNGRVTQYFDDEPASRVDLSVCVQGAPRNAHFYCCGPAPMLDAFEGACANRDASQVHMERFSATEAPDVSGGFHVVLARTGCTVRVDAGLSILDALLAQGLNVSHSCKEGVCGSCETRVLEGEPDHRDSVLGASERASNRTMMICCSGSRSASLVLDL